MPRDNKMLVVQIFFLIVNGPCPNPPRGGGCPGRGARGTPLPAREAARASPRAARGGCGPRGPDFSFFRGKVAKRQHRHRGEDLLPRGNRHGPVAWGSPHSASRPRSRRGGDGGEPPAPSSPPARFGRGREIGERRGPRNSAHPRRAASSWDAEGTGMRADGTGMGAATAAPAESCRMAIASMWKQPRGRRGPPLPQHLPLPFLRPSSGALGQQACCPGAQRAGARGLGGADGGGRERGLILWGGQKSSFTRLRVCRLLCCLLAVRWPLKRRIAPRASPRGVGGGGGSGYW